MAYNIRDVCDLILLLFFLLTYSHSSTRKCCIYELLCNETIKIMVFQNVTYKELHYNINLIRDK